MKTSKNVHLLPTPNPSRLVKLKLFDKEKYNLSKKILPIQDEEQYQNIYITNDEKPKDGDWVAFTNLKKWVPLKYLAGDLIGSEKKIILTTDQDLIKDGVQAIDDEFLEWFVKNPSCERVEIDFSLVSGSFKYIIIIPNLEVWKDVPDFEGYYQVSNVGNVKSLSRTILGKNNTPTLLKEKLLKFSTSTNGYYQVILCKNSDRKIFKVHSLVAICFLNHVPDGTHNIVVDHINEIKTDNSIENLRLIGHRENVSRSIKDSTSTYVGVSWSKNAKKWISQITIEGNTKYLGLFDNEEDANKKYLETLKDL
jgi:hypothetical protein